MNEAIPVWTQIAMGALALVVIFFFGPRALDAARNSPKGNARDWLGLLVPIGAVVLFVIVLIAFARG